MDDFERQVHLYEDQPGRKIPEEVLAATLTAGIENPAISQQLALNATSLDTYVKAKEAARAFVNTTRAWTVETPGA